MCQPYSKRRRLGVDDIDLLLSVEGVTFRQAMANSSISMREAQEMLSETIVDPQSVWKRSAGDS
jgi:hypothetical protein